MVFNGTNNAFGSFGANTSGFGTTNLFGSTQQNQNQGLMRPAGTGSLFGASTTTASTAQPATSGGLFSSGAGGFNFASAGGSQLGQTVPVGTTTKFVPTSAQDSVLKNNVQTTITTSHQCITAMKEYESKSLEELRFEDYQANRKFPQPNQFGGTTGGLFSSQTTAGAGGTLGTSTFGGSNLFGGQQQQQQQAKPAGGFFGLNTSATSATTSSTGLFGQQPNKSIFGSTLQPTTASTSSGFGGFGTTQPATTQSVFGTPQPATTSNSLFGGLSQSTPTAATTTTGGLFGSSNPSTSLFGSTQQQKPAFSGFGSQPTAQPAQQSGGLFNFSQNNQAATATTTGTSLFGGQQQQQQQQQQSLAKPFGSPFGSTLGSTTTTGFGQPAATTGTTGTGLFGSQQTAAKPFGLTSSTSTTTGFGGFGTSTPAGTTGTTTGGGLFGSTGFGQQGTTATGATASPFSTGLGGGLGATPGQTTTGTGLFGSTTQPTTTGGGLFGSQQPTTSGFGGLGSGLGTSTGFGSTTQSTLGTGLGLGQQATTTGLGGGGLFGSTNTSQPSQLGTGLGFGGTSTGLGLGSTQTGSTGGFFGSLGTGGSTSFGAGLNNNTLQNTQQQQQLQANQSFQANQTLEQIPQHQLLALANSPYGSGSLLKSGLQSADQSKRDILKPVSPVAQRQYINDLTSPSKITSIIPTSASSIDIKGGLSQTIKLTPKSLNTISINKKTDLFENLEGEEDAPCFLPRKNIKKLLFKGNTSNGSRPSSANGSLNGDSKIDFLGKKPQSQYLDDTTNKLHSNTTYQIPQMTNDFSNFSEDGGACDNQSEISNGPSNPHPANITLERSGYFTIPSLQDLATMVDAKGDCLVENFAIARVDYGCITFPGITNLANLNLDEIIHIRRKEVHVYPDDTKKPPVGMGLNKPAEVTLHRIWPTDKHTKMPITDPEKIIDMGYNKKIEKATIEMGAQFIDYDPDTGSWTFKVKHFSKYGLHDSDDEDAADDAEHENMQMKAKNFSKLKTLNIIPPALSTGGEVHEKERLTEREMINRQMKLIETRRLELMQRKSMGGAINNQQWDILNEYLPNENASGVKQMTQKSEMISNHIKLNDSPDGPNLIDEDDDKQSEYSTNQYNARRNELIDDMESENKENYATNKIYPNLNEIYKSKQQRIVKETAKIYPNLNDYNLIEEQEEVKYGFKEPKAASTDQMVVNDMPFLSKGNKLRMMFFDNDMGDSDAKSVLNIEEDVSLKMPSLIHRPTIGPNSLLKRGTIDDDMMNVIKSEPANSLLNNERFFSKPKPTRMQSSNLPATATVLSLAEVQQRLGSRILKPRLFDRYTFYKTSNLESQLTGRHRQDNYEQHLREADHIRADRRSQEVDNQLVPTVSNKVGLIPYIAYDQSVTFSLYKNLADAGLFNARRFRVSWSTNPSAATFVQLNLSTNNPTTSSSIYLNVAQILTPSMFSKINSNASFNQGQELNLDRLAVMRDNCTKYLETQLNLTEFTMTSKTNYTNNGHTLAYLHPKYGNDLIRECCDCTLRMRDSIVGDNPDADNVEHMKQVWTLCQSLWGDLSEKNMFNTRLDELNKYELEQIRKKSLSDWLSDVSMHRIDKECKFNKFSKNKDSYLNSIFSLLTGNRLLDACSVAADNQDYRLALLLSQSSGGNSSFRTMMRKQLTDWLSSGSDKYLNNDRLKLNVMMAGDLYWRTNNTPNVGEINVCENLDWKRQFAIHLWYHCLPVSSIYDTLCLYERSIGHGICNKPLPPYLEDSDLASSSQDIYDTCFHLIKLYCNSAHSLADIVAPTSHSSNQLDFRLSWHLTMSLISLKYNQITQSCLENLHHSYAVQLQSLGLWHWAVFILMHIDDEKRREKYVQQYICKNVTSSCELDESERFVIEKLKVPSEWVYEYKALRAKYESAHENQVRLLIKAHKWNEAHSVLIEYLAPDYFMNEKWQHLMDYLIPLAKESMTINKWSIGGQIYFEFIQLNQKVNKMFALTDLSERRDKWFSESMLNELRDQANSLSLRIKDFDSKTPKKLLCCINISKLLLRVYNFLYELTANECDGMDDDQQQLMEESSQFNSNKLVSLSLIEKANQLTQNVPDQDIIGNMLLTKSKLARASLNR